MQFLKNLSKKALPFLFKKSKSIPSECPVIEQITPTEPTKDKIIFQRNSISTKSSVECSTNALAQVNSKIVDHTPGMNNIIVECDMQSIGHLQSLCQFFEISQNEAIARGIWLLSIAKDVELNNKKIGVIAVDPSGLVTDIIPINIV